MKTKQNKKRESSKELLDTKPRICSRKKQTKQHRLYQNVKKLSKEQ